MKFPHPFSGNGDQVYAVIETPKGSRNKYDFNEKYGCYELNKVLPQGTCFPLDFGFIPHTRAEDGDPLDILILMDAEAFTGCLVECRLIGIIEILQTERDGRQQRNDRVVGISITSRNHAQFNHISDLNETFKDELVHFFKYYNTMAGKQLEVIALKGPAEAVAAVKKHITMWG